MGPLSDQEPHPTVTVSTFGDDPAVWKHDVLGTAARDDGDGGVQPQTLLDAHGQEGQLGQVVPKEPPRQLSREQKQTCQPPALLLPCEIPFVYDIITDGSNSVKPIMLYTLNMYNFFFVHHSSIRWFLKRKKNHRSTRQNLATYFRKLF